MPHILMIALLTSAAVSLTGPVEAQGVPPTVTGISPLRGAIGAAVNIDGSGFTTATEVDWAGSTDNSDMCPSATCLIMSDTRITATVPPGAITGPISVVNPDGSAPSGQSYEVAPAPQHVVVIMLENKERGKINATSAPYLFALGQAKVLLTNSYGEAHGSAHDYKALTDGFLTVASKNIAVDQLEPAGYTWKAYMEAMPGPPSAPPCYTGKTAGRPPHTYVKGHDPFIAYASIRKNPTRCANIVPYTTADQVATDLTAGFRYAWITPDNCDNMHDCSVAQGDAWLQANVPTILSALGTNGLLIITFDEGNSTEGCCLNASGGRIFTVIAGPGAADHTQITTDADHYSMLQLIESALGLSFLGNAANAPSIDGYACPSPPCTVNP